MITRWNPFWSEKERFEPRTIEVHCQILEDYSNNDQYVWYGKISKSGNLGIDQSDIESIMNQILSGVEVHFYMYCPEKSSLHVGKLKEISATDHKGDPHTPSYYSQVPYKTEFWFKLSDIRRLDLYAFLVSGILREENGDFFDPVTTRRFYPSKVYEDPPQTFFNYGFTRGRKWFPRAGAGGMIPRCFKTGGLTCSNPDAQQPELKKRVFIGMPFTPEFENMYKHGIKPALDSLGLMSWKADEKFRNIDLMCNICAGIQISGIAIVDISDWNPNTLFELGLIYALGKEALIIRNKKAKQPPSDLKGMTYIPYDDYDKLKETLMRYLSNMP